MTRKPLLLIVEDDPAIRRILKNNLDSDDYRCEETNSLEVGIGLSQSLNPDLILLDIGLPDGDGVSLIRQIRKNSAVPILVLSARESETEKVRALEEGANDYMTKPFGLAELKARIRVALRQSSYPRTQGKISFDDLSIDLDARRIFLADTEVHLTRLEYKLLLVMARNPGKILTSSFLLKEVWGYDSTSQKHYVKVLTAGLRKKLERDPSRPQFVHTESGVGYRFYN